MNIKFLCYKDCLKTLNEAPKFLSFFQNITKHHLMISKKRNNNSKNIANYDIFVKILYSR